MSTTRKERLLREALGDERRELPGVEGVVLTGAVCAILMIVVLFVG